MRFAPDKVGTWKWTVKSADAGLNGKSGSFECVPSSRRGSIQTMAGAPRHFQYQNGERMWFMGDTAWAYVTDSVEEKHDRSTAERYLSNRADQGFNAIHFMLISEAGWGNRGGPPWTDIASERINPAYFQEADHRIAFANAKDVVTGVVVAWGKVTLYGDGNYGGKNLLVEDDIPDLGETEFGKDGASSIKVEENGKATLYSDTNYTERWYYDYTPIKAKHSGKALDESTVSSYNGGNIHQWDYVGNNNQKWKLIPDGGDYYRIVAKHSGKCGAS
jgi:hypothetical protein